MTTRLIDDVVHGRGTDMNQLIRRRPPTAEDAADAEAKAEAEAEDAPPSFDGGARESPAAATDMNKVIRRQLRGRG